MLLPRLVMLMLALALGACGYHLRGEDSGVPGLLPIAVEAPLAHQAFAQQLRQRLASRGWGSEAGQAKASVVILSETRDKRVGSLSSGGLVSEYVLEYRLRYEVRDAQGASVQSPRQINYQRIYRFDPAQALAMTWQEERLVQTLRGLTTDDIIRALSLMKAPGR